ncbi:3-oxoacyl-ACP reductase FabG [Salinisphaera sp.]|uniref:3-oxoacyl-ACP reductase FabG n=1 Tax=Salinisphaera sp. TaxID=1914330 RepID=UPI002D7978B8|nr:3-oxoacyl-ACP reductase FabG [Salinisphaera sp.]HET7313274.1 3-oxoacyl-ACP reductase FabG [Salinisphaera sp.]
MSDTILVTGASRGIGRAIAEKLARDGFDIVVHYRERGAAAAGVVETIRGLGRGARLLCFDSADREAARTAIEADIAAHGAYYGLVLNAGVVRDAVFPALTDEAWDSVLDTNLDGFYNVAKPCVMPMIKRRKPGRIVALSSVAGLIGNRGQVNYSAAKAGIIGAAKALALDLAGRRITVNCVAPGLIETEMTHDLPADALKRMIPQQRMGRPEDVAAAVSFLCSGDAGYITRQVLSVNGGLC